jgi:hypothetical protein
MQIQAPRQRNLVFSRLTVKAEAIRKLALIGLSPVSPTLRKFPRLKNSQNTFLFAKHCELANRLGLSITSVYTP